MNIRVYYKSLLSSCEQSWSAGYNRKNAAEKLKITTGFKEQRLKHTKNLKFVVCSSCRASVE